MSSRSKRLRARTPDVRGHVARCALAKDTHNSPPFLEAARRDDWLRRAAEAKESLRAPKQSAVVVLASHLFGRSILHSKQLGDEQAPLLLMPKRKRRHRGRACYLSGRSYATAPPRWDCKRVEHSLARHSPPVESTWGAQAHPRCCWLATPLCDCGSSAAVERPAQSAGGA